MTQRSTVDRLRILAGLFVVWTMAWSTTGGEIAEDTKNDLYVDPWGFLGRALHLWDPQTTFGVLQNQGYGYLFPMGPFFGIVGEVAPMWVVQRLWWSLLLTLGYLGALRLLRALGIGGPATQHVAALAYALGPRVVTTLGGLSSEAAPVLLLPWILVPLVEHARGRRGARQAAALSGLAVLGCGGVNASATLLALVPAGLWLVTRRGWWRSSLTAWWAVAVVGATAWWVAPLVLLGRYSPPFLDWIEKASVVTGSVGLLDVVRGTTHWLGHLVTAGGPWWPAGYDLVTHPWLVLATSALAALGLAGLLARGLPHRGYLVTLMVLGVVILAVPHAGPADSPLALRAQSWLDGPLAPFRNVHKADALVRLPFVVGLAHVLGRAEAGRFPWPGRLLPDRGAHPGHTVARRLDVLRPHARWAVGTVVALLVLAVASPGLAGDLAPRGTFAAMSPSWVQAGRWLDSHSGGTRALIVPASTFGEYTWGRTIDEPLRPLTSADYAVRDGVPLTPAGTIRLLDAVEQRLQTGRDLGGAVDALLAAGVKHLVLRNDLDTTATGGTPVVFARSALKTSPRVHQVAGFGRTFRDLSGERVQPVEIYQLQGQVAAPLEQWDLADVRSASGESESLADLADAGLLDGPVVFDADRGAVAVPLGGRTETDGFRARQRYFGATRGEDVTNVLTPDQARDATDYLPAPGPGLRSTVAYTGIAGVRASSSIAGDLTFAGLNPAYRPYAALDGSARTAWATYGDSLPTLTVDFGRTVDPAGLRIAPFADRSKYGDALAVPTTLEVTTDRGSTRVRLDPSAGLQGVPVADGTTRTLAIRILDTSEGDPARNLTGLSEVSVPGVRPAERIDLPVRGSSAPEPTDAVVLTAGGAGRDGCVVPAAQFRCLGGRFREAEDTGPMERLVAVRGRGEFALTGRLTSIPNAIDDTLLRPEGIVDVTASSVRSLAPQDRPTAAFDGDPATAWSPAVGDRSPTITATFAKPVTVGTLRLVAREEWSQKNRPVIQVTVDGRRELGRVAGDGTLVVPTMTGRTVRLQVILGAAETDSDAGTDAALSLELAEVELAGQPQHEATTAFSAPCGSGPTVRVDDVVVPTRLSGPRSALYGVGQLDWAACDPVTLGASARDTVRVEPWQGFAPTLTVARRAGSTDSAAAPGSTDSAAAPSRGTRVTGSPAKPAATMDGQLAAGPSRLVALTQNENRGWRATLDGAALTPVTVDGYRQAFLVPEGASGRLHVWFAPDGAYRLSLLVGALLAVLLLGLALLPVRAGRGVGAADGIPVDTTAHAPAARPRPAWVDRVLPAGAAVALGGLLAGGWGLVVGLVVVALSQVGRRRSAIVASVVAGLVLLAGLVQVVGSSWPADRLELVTRLGCLAALLLVVGRPAHRGAAPAGRRGDGASGQSGAARSGSS